MKKEPLTTLLWFNGSSSNFFPRNAWYVNARSVNARCVHLRKQRSTHKSKSREAALRQTVIMHLFSHDGCLRSHFRWAAWRDVDLCVLLCFRRCKPAWEYGPIDTHARCVEFWRWIVHLRCNISVSCISGKIVGTWTIEHHCHSSCRTERKSGKQTLSWWKRVQCSISGEKGQK